MPRGVSQASVERCIRAAAAQGKTVHRILLRPDGSVEVIMDGAQESPNDAALRELAEWDREHANG